ncbi:MAG TPA: VOC family protein [Myxococcota bacterium]|nr:VOC family protein [Myxococcota bacterium]
MTLWLRQIALVARDRDRAAAALREVLGLEIGHIDPGVGRFGLHNVLLPVGGQFIEIVAPVQEGTTAGRYLERRRGDGGYMVILQASDHAPVKRRVAELGLRKVLEFEQSGYSCLQLHPRDTGGSFLEIDHQENSVPPDGAWEPAGHHWKEAVRTERVRAIAAAEIQAPDPEKLAARWSEILEVPVANASGACVLGLANATIRFVPDADGRGEGLGGIDLVATDRAAALAAARERGLLGADGALALCGMRVRLV